MLFTFPNTICVEKRFTLALFTYRCKTIFLSQKFLKKVTGYS